MSPDPPPTASTSSDDVDPCAVKGCRAPSIRHLSLPEAKKVFTDLPDKGRRAPLCRDHYREWKKATKSARKLDRLGWG